ncbi:MAG: hypothetical protein ACI9G5_002254, partial [Paracoccaceae bacterium]
MMNYWWNMAYALRWRDVGACWYNAVVEQFFG